MSLTNFAVVFPLDRAIYSPASCGGLDDNALCMSAPVHHRTLNPDHQGAGGLLGLKLTREINICLADYMHGRSFVPILFYIYLVVFLCDAICDVTILCLIVSLTSVGFSLVAGTLKVIIAA
jgi:hypothetical protein